MPQTLIYEERKFKYGQFGYGKYVYPKETLQEMDSLFRGELKEIFPVHGWSIWCRFLAHFMIWIIRIS